MQDWARVCLSEVVDTIRTNFFVAFTFASVSTVCHGGFYVPTNTPIPITSQFCSPGYDTQNELFKLSPHEFGGRAEYPWALL